MKRTLPVLIAVAILMAGCKKSSKTDVSPVNTADSYLPVTTGSQWTYGDNTNGTVQTRTITATGGTTIINNKTYNNASVKVTETGTTNPAYLYAANHLYAMRIPNNDLGLTIELQMCIDNQPAGYSWTSLPTDDGTINGVSARMANTIKEVNINKSAFGKNYPNVIHTQSEIQYNYGGGYQTAATYDFYLAKGVGLIYLTVSTSTGAVYETEILEAH